jgi:hypothetical protein
MLPRFPAEGEVAELRFDGVEDGIYSVQEGQYRVAIEGGRVVWSAALNGDAEDYLAGAKTEARPMTVQEVKMVLRTVLTAHDWARTWAHAMAQGDDVE